MSAQELDKDVLATLTDEECELLIADDADDGDPVPQGDDPDDDGEDDDGDDGEDLAAPPVEGKPAATVTAEVTPPAAEDDADEPEPARRTTYRATVPEGHAEQLAALTEADSALAAKFESGEIDFNEFRAQSAELNQRRLELSKAQIKAEISAEMGEQTAEQEWQDTIKQFMTAAKPEGIDYRKDEAKRNDLDKYVKALAADDDNADKPMRWFLEEAHRIVKAKHGILTAAPKADAPAGKPAARKPDASTIPTTLAHVPGSDGPGDISDEFAEIDRLEGMEQEDAIARMTPAQREKYLKAA